MARINLRKGFLSIALLALMTVAGGASNAFAAPAGDQRAADAIGANTATALPATDEAHAPFAAAPAAD
jgi:hypothetical protein